MKKVLVFALSALALLSCNREVAPVQPESTGSEVRFKANIPNTFEFKSTALEGKQVRIVAGAPINATTVATAEGEVLTPVDVIRWNLNQTDKTTFAAIYGGESVPAAPENMEIPYSVVNDGNHDVAYHSAYLLAVAKDVEPNSEVELNFSHPFSKVCVAVTNEIEGFTVKSVIIRNAVTNGVFDLADGSVELGNEKADIYTSLVEDKYTAVIFPQEVKLAIYITLGKEGEEDQVFAFALKEAKEFVANKAYNAAITLTPATPSVGDPVSFGFEVADWAAGDNLETEGIEIPAEPEDVWTVIGLGGDWDTDVAMTKNTNGEWEADITYAEGDEFKLRANGGWTKSAGMKAAGTFPVGTDNTDPYLEENSSINIKLAEAGAYHLAFNPTNYYFVVTANNTNPPAPTTVTLTLNVYNGAEWTNLHTYIYGTSEAAGAWPGKAAEATDVVVNNNTFKSFVIEGLPLNSNAEHYIINNGGNGSQTGDLDLPAFTEATATMYVWLKAGGAVEVIADPATFDPSAAVSATLTLNVFNSTSWTAFYCYTFGTGEYAGAWPGKAAEATDVVVNNNTFKSFVIENLPLNSTAEHYIINNGNGGNGNQTGDLDLPALTLAESTLYVHLKEDLSVEVIDPANFDPTN